MISKRTSDEQLKKRLEQTLRENIKKRKLQKQMRDSITASDINTNDDGNEVKSSANDQLLRESSS